MILITESSVFVASLVKLDKICTSVIVKEEVLLLNFSIWNSELRNLLYDGKEYQKPLQVIFHSTCFGF